VTKRGGVMVFQIADRWQEARPSGNVGREDLPVEFCRAQEPIMLRCETPYAAVVKVLEGAGVRVIAVEEDARADPTLVFAIMWRGRNRWCLAGEWGPAHLS
jgi:hypothetical protein